MAVALGTHNGALFVEEQLLSVLNQTVLPQEIIVSDDCSTDNTLKLIHDLFERETALRPELASIHLTVIPHKHHLGINLNYEIAFKQAGTHLIAFCDQDDVWLSNKLETLLDYAADNPELLFIHSDAGLINAAGD